MTSAISLATVLLNKLPNSLLEVESSLQMTKLTRTVQLLMNAMMNYKGLTSQIFALLLLLSSKIKSPSTLRNFFNALIGPSPTPALRAVLLNIYKKASEAVDAAEVFAPFLREMVSCDIDNDASKVSCLFIIFFCLILSSFLGGGDRRPALLPNLTAAREQLLDNRDVYLESVIFFSQNEKIFDGDDDLKRSLVDFGSRMKAKLEGLPWQLNLLSASLAERLNI